MNNLDRKKIIALLQDKKMQHYGFLIVFFIIFSFFVIFAIRPNLLTAFNLQKELQDLKLQNREFESKIQKIVSYQTFLETYREDLPLLDEAVPQSPEIAKVMEDVRQSATDSSVLIRTLKVESVDYKAKSKGPELQTFSINADAEATSENLRAFFDRLLAQRRLKSLDFIDISKSDFTGDQSSDINIYKMNIVVSSNYL